MNNLLYMFLIIMLGFESSFSVVEYNVFVLERQNAIFITMIWNDIVSSM